MNPDSLRRNGPMNADVEGIKDSDRDFPTNATPHPDTLNPTNDLSKHMAADVPKTGLGGKGHAQMDRK